MTMPITCVMISFWHLNKYFVSIFKRFALKLILYNVLKYTKNTINGYGYHA